MKTLTDIIAPKLELLESKKTTLLRYATSMLDSGDYHAVQDSMSDLRDVDAKIEVLKQVLEEVE